MSHFPRIILSAAVCALLILASCANNPRSADTAAPSAAVLPLLSELAALSHTASATPSIDGADFIDNGGTVTPVGTAAELTADSGELAWALYSAVIPAGATVSSVEVTASSTGTAPWLAYSDFSTGRWQLAQLGAAGGTVSLDRPAVELGSSACRVYFGVLAFDGPATVDSIVVTHDGDTVLNWSHSWGTDFSEDMRYIGVDAAGNVYAAVDRDHPSSNDVDPILLKYGPDGTLLKARRWSDPALYGGSALGIRDFLVTPSGETYTGYTGGSSRNAFILKTDANLNLEWCRIFATAGGAQDSHAGMGFDALGNIVWHINISPSAGDDYGALVWLAPDGTLVRQQLITIGTASDTNLILRRFAVDPLSGDTLICGNRKYYPAPSAGTHALMRVKSDGTLVFSKLVTTTQFINSSFSENGVTHDGAGNMLTCCDSIKPLSTDPTSGILVLRTGPAGNLLTANKLEIQGASDLRPQRIDATTGGDPFIEIRADFGSGDQYGALRFNRADAQPLDWQTFFTGGLDNDIAEFCGSWLLGSTISSGGAVVPVHQSGDQFTITDVGAEVGLLDTGDTLSPLLGDAVFNQAASTVEDYAGNVDLLDQTTSSDALVRRFVPTS
jgi:hypothetical protein